MRKFQRKLEGYKFPVYSTVVCPKNEAEWEKRSSALMCSEENAYMCLPNEHFTELLEFCYTESRTLIEEGKIYRKWLLYCFVIHFYFFPI